MILHHYTSAAGLDGIIRNRCIWASDYRFMNDSSEFRYAVDVFKRHLAAYKGSRHLPQSPEFLGLVTDRVDRLISSKLDDPLGYKVFVASFSEEPDLLSQWRGYNNGKGFSLGIDSQWIADNAGEQGFELLPVIYDESLQAQAVIMRLEVLCKEYKASGDPSKDWNRLNTFWLNALQVITALKHPTFKEEKERRLVKVATAWPRDVKTRSNASGFVPYVELSLMKKPAHVALNHPNNLGFQEVILGPALHARQRTAVDALVSSQGMRFAIKDSAIPYVAD